MNAHLPMNAGRRCGARLVLAVLAAALLAGMAAAPSARASHENPCTNAQITEAVSEVTGVTPLGDVCNPRLYNNGRWASYSELKTHVATVMNGCGNEAGHRRLVQAVIHVASVPPRGAACAKEIYRMSVDDRHNYTQRDEIDWTRYQGNVNSTTWAPYDAIYSTLWGCSRPMLSLALIETTGRYPNQGTDYVNQQTNGECHPWMYRNAELSDWATVVTYVQQRKNSTLDCADSQITQAVVELSGGFKPIGPSSTTGECDPVRYGGSWSSLADLKTRVQMAWRCRDPWIGIAYKYGVGRNPRGFGVSGECNVYLYGSGQWSGYGDLVSKVQESSGALTGEGIELRSSGDLVLRRDGIVTSIPAAEVYIGNGIAGIISTGGGNLISDKGLGIIAPGGGNITSLAGGSLIGQAGGNLISENGLGIIAAGGGNIIAAGGGNIIATGGGNALASGVMN